MEDFGFKFWLKMAGIFVLGAIALFIVMWIFLERDLRLGLPLRDAGSRSAGRSQSAGSSTAGTRVRARAASSRPRSGR